MHKKYIIVSIVILVLLSIIFLLFKYFYSKPYEEPDIIKDLEKQTMDTNEKNIKFDIYFKNPEKTHKLVSNIDEKSNLYIYIKVDEGYLKNAKLEIKSEEGTSANFTIESLAENSKYIESIEKNLINLNQIDKSSEIELEIPIKSIENEEFDLGYFALLNNVEFSGKYINKNGNEENIYKEIKIKKEWTQNAEAELSQKIIKYIPYSIEGKAGILVQELVTSNLKNNVLPIKQTQINVQVPTIQEIKPEAVRVDSYKTMATNGDVNGSNFNENNWVYNKTTNKVSITVDNKLNEQKKIKWEKDGKDEYVITYIFPKESYEKINGTGDSIILQADSIIHAYNNTVSEIKKTSYETVDLEKKEGEIIDVNIKTTEKVYKEFIVENDSYKTEYSNEIKLNIYETNLINKLCLTPEDSILKNDNQVINIENNMIYKNIKVSKENFDKSLGQNGYINVFNGDILQATINKDTELTENEEYLINLEDKQLSNIRLEISKPIEAGKIIIESQKYIKGCTTYSKEEIKQFSEIRTNLKIDCMTEQSNTIASILKMSKTKLEDVVTKAELEISNNRLSTELKNEIQLKAILRKDDKKFELYKNPILEFEMPEEIENVKIKDIKMLYENELKIKSQDVIENESKHKVVKIELEGIQTKHDIGLITKGTNIILDLDIVTKEIEEDKKNKIIMKYQNENATNYGENGGIETKEVNYITPSGIDLSKTEPIKVKSFASVDNGEDVYEKQIITYKVEITNTSLEKLENIKIKSKVPDGTTCLEYEDNPNKEEFMVLVKNDEVKDEEWNIDTLDIGETVIKEYEVEVGSWQDKIENEFIVEVMNKKIITEKLINNVKKAKISVEFRNEYEGRENLEKGSKLRYVLHIDNISEDEIKNINIFEKIPYGLKYKNIDAKVYNSQGGYEKINVKEKYDEKSEILKYKIKKLTKDQKAVIKLDLEVTEKVDKEINDQVIVKTDKMNYKSNFISSTIEQPKYEFSIESPTNKEITEGQDLEYIIKVKNKNKKSKIHVKVKDILPKEIVPEKVEYGIEGENILEYTVYNNTLTIDNLIEKGKTFVIKVKAKVGKISDEIKINNYATMEINKNSIVKTKLISHTINKKRDVEKNNNSIKESNNVTGCVWVDANKDGQIDEKEKNIKNVEVRIRNIKSNEICQKTKTNSKGQYEFKNLKNGSYIVEFDYNNKDYEVTEYNANGTTTTGNSDVIDVQVEENEILVHKAMSDKINLEKNTTKNINLGLIEKNKFDLSLQIYISKITINSNNKEKVYMYKNEKATKINIPQKFINDANMEIEYKIVVSNNGNIPGYAKRIDAYFGKDLELKAEKNTNWDIKNNEKVCTYALKNDIIEIGESKELSLILDKNISKDTNIINNMVEISEDYNEKALLDYDSMPNNKKQTEDDISSANISITTGVNKNIALYIGIITIILGLTIASIYATKHNVKKAKIKEGSESNE